MTGSQRAYQVLRWTGWPASRRRSRAAIFCFHNVVDGPVVDADASLHLPVEHFGQLLDWIQDAYHVVPLAELLDRATRSQAVGGLAALTFDDAYVGCLRLGLPLLSDRGLPSTLYVVSGAADHPRPFWWDLAGANRRLTDDTRTAALTRWAGRGDAVQAGLNLEARSIPTDLWPAPWSMISAAGGPSLTIGCHTTSHPSLTALSAEQLTEEFSVSRHAIGDHLGSLPTTVSYPYGLHNAVVRARALDAGFTFGLALGSDPISGAVDPFAVPRINVPANVTAEKLECWAAGLRWNKPR